MSYSLRYWHSRDYAKGWMTRGSNPETGNIFYSQKFPDWLRRPSNFIFEGNLGPSLDVNYTTAEVDHSVSLSAEEWAKIMANFFTS
jgi:hypothetical protein